MTFDFRILGPLEVSGDGGPVALGGQKPRAVLAAMLLEARRVVSTDRLVDRIWGEEPTEDGDHVAPELVSRLRQGARRRRLVTRRARVRAWRRARSGSTRPLRATHADARGAGLEERRGTPVASARLWRGPRWPSSRSSRSRRGRSGGSRSCGSRGRGAARGRLELGWHGDVVAELEGLVREHPLRARSRRQLMMALYRCRTAGGGARGVPGRPSRVRRRARDRARAGAPAAPAEILRLEAGLVDPGADARRRGSPRS